MQKVINTKSFPNDLFVSELLNISTDEISEALFEIIKRPFELIKKKFFYEDISLLQKANYEFGTHDLFFMYLSDTIYEKFPKVAKKFRTLQYKSNPEYLGETVTLDKFLEWVFYKTFVESRERCNISSENAILLKEKIDEIRKRYNNKIESIPHKNDEDAMNFMKINTKEFAVNLANHLLGIDLTHIRRYSKEEFALDQFLVKNYKTYTTFLSSRTISDFMNGIYTLSSGLSEKMFSEVSSKLIDINKELTSLTEKSKIEEDQKNEKEKQAKFKKTADELVKKLASKEFIGITRSQLTAFLIDNNISENALSELYPMSVWVDYINSKLGFKKSIKTSSRKPLPTGIRLEVFKRDKGKCVICGRGPPEVTLHVDHIIPVSKGGKDTLDNLRTLCSECNLNKKDLLL